VSVRLLPVPLALLLLLPQLIIRNSADTGTVTTAITAPTSSATYDAGTASTITTLAGTASSDRTVTGCTWANDLGGSGSATGTTSWSIASVSLTVGANVITVTCTNNTGGTGQDVITVTRSGASDYYTGTVRTAASCARADVLTEYTAASSLDIIDIPTGDCDASNQWSSPITITKSLMIRGNGTANTIIGVTGGDPAFSIQTDNVRITEIQFDCNFGDSTGRGVVQVGGTNANPTWEYSDFRIDNNIFRNCGASGGDTTGRDAISVNGHAYGVIDHNTFNDCNGECIDICHDGVLALARSNEYGQYTNGTVFVEDNTFNANRAIAYENVIDGNSGYRVTFRYNTINLTNGAWYASGIISGHETCARCTSSSPEGDAGSLVTEIYENTVNLGTDGNMEEWSRCRGGRCLVYNNYITYTGSDGRYTSYGMVASNYRSNQYTLAGLCGSASNGRGYADYCHETDGVLTVEGLTAGITTLDGAINASTTTVVLASTAGLDTNGDANGFAIKIDLETICYTGVSGNTLTGVTRGCGASTTNGSPSQAAASHSNGASVAYLKFGQCLEQPNNSYIFNNAINGVVDTDQNTVHVCSTSSPLCDGFDGPDYTALDIKSFAERPNNWQYKEGSLSYTPYTYPHPLQSTTGPN
jgi:hypothetical protein